MLANFTVNFQIKALTKHEFDGLTQLNNQELASQSAQ
jgi:hypothetical protein